MNTLEVPSPNQLQIVDIPLVSTRKRRAISAYGSSPITDRMVWAVVIIIKLHFKLRTSLRQRLNRFKMIPVVHLLLLMFSFYFSTTEYEVQAVKF